MRFDPIGFDPGVFRGNQGGAGASERVENDRRLSPARARIKDSAHDAEKPALIAEPAMHGQSHVLLERRRRAIGSFRVDLFGSRERVRRVVVFAGGRRQQWCHFSRSIWRWISAISASVKSGSLVRQGLPDRGILGDRAEGVEPEGRLCRVRGIRFALVAAQRSRRLGGVSAGAVLLEVVDQLPEFLGGQRPGTAARGRRADSAVG